MKCPHCLVEFHANLQRTHLPADVNGQWYVSSYLCPNPQCNKGIHYLTNGVYNNNTHVPGVSYAVPITNKLFYPKGSLRPPVPIEVPQSIADDYIEACAVIDDSPKASAALSRRCLQNILLESAQVAKGDLSKQIQEVLDSGKLPSHLEESIDAVRNIGNFAAHPNKDKNTGVIVDVEPHEAEWNLEVLEALFDFYYVQPEKSKARKAALDAKLAGTGKPPMK